MIKIAVISSSSQYKKIQTIENSPKKMGNKKNPQLELAVPIYEG